MSNLPQWFWTPDVCPCNDQAFRNHGEWVAFHDKHGRCEADDDRRVKHRHCFHAFERQPFEGLTASFCCADSCRDVVISNRTGEEKTHGLRVVPTLTLRLVDFK